MTGRSTACTNPPRFHRVNMHGFSFSLSSVFISRLTTIDDNYVSLTDEMSTNEIRMRGEAPSYSFQSVRWHFLDIQCQCLIRNRYTTFRYDKPTLSFLLWIFFFFFIMFAHVSVGCEVTLLLAVSSDVKAFALLLLCSVMNKSWERSRGGQAAKRKAGVCRENRLVGIEFQTEDTTGKQRNALCAKRYQATSSGQNRITSLPL